MTIDKLTAVLLVFKDRAAAGQVPPTYREICEEAGISSTSQVRLRVKELIERGLLQGEPGLARGVTLAGDEWDPAKLREQIASLQKQNRTQAEMIRALQSEIAKQGMDNDNGL